ncbi:MAG: multicopper oxidase domain-containing protein [Gammaproteobacteria bacterium]|nr:multicopper oxidase domain-containing protein [Gammaproteobacteria bacterium]
MINRRKTLKALGIGALGASGIPGLITPKTIAQHSELATTALNSLNIPPLEEGSITDTVRQFQLTMQRGSRSFLPDSPSETLGINGDYLGPTLHFRRNEDVSLQIHNQIGEPTTLHWHGFHIPASEDGGPHQTIAVGDTWNPQYKVLQPAGTYWYHSHMLHKSAEQVYKGLAGLIIVDDESNEELDLPSTYGTDDIPLIVQDRNFNREGALVYRASYEDTVIGTHGDTILVNGTWRPYFEPQTALVRFRLLNAANARTFTFAFSDGREFYQIASDGGLLNSPVPMTTLELAVAERAEILVDFSDGREVTLVSLGKTPTFPEFPGGMSGMIRSLNAQSFDILAIRPQQNLSGQVILPQRLENIGRPTGIITEITRKIRLSMGFGTRSGDDRGPGRGARNGRGGGHGGGHFSINGRVMDVNYINERIPLYSTEIWELTNTSPMMHPFHIHHGLFQVLDRDGAPPPANELGWKDTVKVNPGELVRIVMRFEDFADPDNPYMYHCHILEHEDRGMMGQFLVV